MVYAGLAYAAFAAAALWAIAFLADLSTPHASMAQVGVQRGLRC
jgi:hypothetical protein